MKTSRFIVLVLFIIGLLLQSGLGQAQSNVAQTASAVGQAQDTVETDMAEVAQAEAIKTNERKIPRFVSLRPETVNVRSGPGLNYPIEWVFQRRGLPVEVVAEYDTWRKIRDFESTEGWVHQSMLSPQRGLVITGDIRPMRQSASDTAKVVARVEPGVVGSVRECKGDWCQANIAGIKGWVKRAEFWGVYPAEEFE